MTPKILLAAEYAAKAHDEVMQRRKYTDEPYIVHPLSVARIVWEHGGDEDMVCAALLHDVVEDTKKTHGNVLTVFGASICELVMECTEISKLTDGNHDTRKAMDDLHFSRASARGQTIKLADQIDNGRTIMLHDRDFARKFFTRKLALLEIMTKGDGRLYYQARRQCEEFFANDERKP